MVLNKKTLTTGEEGRSLIQPSLRVLDLLSSLCILPVFLDEPQLLARQVFDGVTMASSTKVVTNTITTITERLDTLRVHHNETTITIIDDIKRHLSTINDISCQSHIHTHEWITDVMDLLIDLWKLLTNSTSLHPKQGTLATSFFSSLFSSTPRGLVLHLEQINKRLEPLAADSTKFSLKGRTIPKARHNDPEFQGRIEDRNVMIQKILTCTKVEGVVSVAAIVGMQGMGKTALAKFVCDDPTVRVNFEAVIQVDTGIHGEFYADSVKKTMIQQLDPEKDDLGDAIRGRRFLLLLDDLRSENREEWLKLYEMLKKAATATSRGGGVLVTTRNYHVASLVDVYAWRLHRLRKEDSWSLFSNLVGGNSSNQVYQKMEKKCKGVPLALVRMARILKSKPETELKQYQLEKQFMQEMKSLYFNDLPTLHQKQCFAYLSLLFPTHFIYSDGFNPIHFFSVKAETLIQLWTAEGFLGHVDLNSPQHPQPEDLGLHCIQEFTRSSILVLDNSELMTYKMDNELIWELSRFVASKDRFCFSVNNRVEAVKETVRRVALSSSLNVTHGIPKFLIDSNKALHTLLFPMPYSYDWSSRIPYEVKLSWSACHELFRAFKCLRVLNLTDLGMKTLPNSIGELKSLRYLDLSRNNMEKLPKSIGKLKHLQTLILSHCHQLRKLPNELQHLVNLRHLVMDDCLRLKQLPLALKKLTSLLTLSHFKVSTRNNNNSKSKHILGFQELANLKNLSGKLEISHLEQLKLKKSEQGLSYLKEKQHLKHLALKWNHDDNDNNDHNENDETSLGHLEPHVNLQGLKIVGYRGAEFSPWLLSLENLVTFSLYNCSRCKYLPPLDRFPKLKSLRLKRLDSLEYINTNTDQNKLSLEFLQDLSISDCPALKSWWKGVTEGTVAIFASLSNLEIQYCPKLECMPLYPNLNGKLMLEGSSMKPLSDTIKNSSSNMSSSPPLYNVKRLTITNVEGKEESPLPENWLESFICVHYLCISGKMQRMRGFTHLTSLSTMCITKCRGDDLPDNNQWQGLKNLRRLEIQEVDKLKTFPEGVKHLTSLTKLSILSCPELISLGEGIGELKSLQLLYIRDCNKLGSLPKELSEVKSLQELSVMDCRLLLPRCQRETGDDWPHIMHIGRIRLAGASEIYE
ncbi:hypothetical protein PIB30_084243 [Stylosanthes scabra]|uniref:NB-ARC domain-containing protein n=1 Tax=Stylosanthes scabra TaxID=79078 RepID=A0ABU6YQR4_9FABA|nr:hypothetical protein [Stylosanthes scabra]